MTATLFSACILIGFSPLFSLFCLLIMRRPQLLIVAIVAAFFWLLAFLVSSIVWYIIPPFYSSSEALLVLCVLFVEASRYAYIKLFARAERSFSVVSINAIVFPLSDIYSATAAGFGYGVINSLMFYGSLLSHSLGPAALFSSQCPQYSTFILAAWNSFLFSLLHIFLMIIAFDAFRSTSLPRFLVVWALHLSAVLLTLLNLLQGGCTYSLFIVAGVVGASAIIALYVARSPNYRSAKKTN